MKHPIASPSLLSPRHRKEHTLFYGIFILRLPLALIKLPFLTIDTTPKHYAFFFFTLSLSETVDLLGETGGGCGNSYVWGYCHTEFCIVRKESENTIPTLEMAKTGHACIAWPVRSILLLLPSNNTSLHTVRQEL